MGFCSTAGLRYFGDVAYGAVGCRVGWSYDAVVACADLVREGQGELIVTVANLGDAAADGEADPIKIVDRPPPGLTVKSISGTADEPGRGPLTCEKTTLTCTFSSPNLPAYDMFEVRIKVTVGENAEAGEMNEVSVSGGGAPPASIRRGLSIGAEGVPVPFGLEDYELGFEEEGGTPDTQAGSHPFQQTVSLTLNQASAVTGEKDLYEARPAALVKDVPVNLPAGFIGNPTEFPTCTLAKFLTLVSLEKNACPTNTAVGVALVAYDEVGLEGLVSPKASPIFNLEPAFGEPARFGFTLPVTPILIETALREGQYGEKEPDYGVTASSDNIAQTAAFLSSEITLWGVPGDARHDESRSFGCLETARGVAHPELPCVAPEGLHPSALLTLPTSCAAPLQSTAEVDPWDDEGVFSTPLPSIAPLPTLDGCNRLSFSPRVEAEPTTDRASAPTGLNFNIDFDDEGLVSGEGLSQSRLKNTVVTLPEGLTINPSAGVGLAGCTPADYARETISSAPGEGCPNSSKLGSAEVTSPLLTSAIHGSLFIAEPYENPFDSLVALYVVFKNPENGVLIKLAGKVVPNPVTGQLTTIFENTPQLPFAHFNFHFREGQQAPLISPPVCGTYTTQARLTPWSEPTQASLEQSTFSITEGYDGGPCPSGGVPPFKPGIESGTLNNNAGAFSSFYLHLTRTDAEQEISGFSTDLPSGLTGDLSGIPFCPEADIALARVKTGAQEEASPSCPAASQVGHSLVGTGVGAVLAYVPGKLYLAGPYHGDPLSLVSITSAVVGPFDLGTVVLRFALGIDPHTAQVSVDPVASEPIPTILDGIVTHVRDIRVYVDRQGFIVNPTSCNPLAISSTLNSNLGGSATVSSPFQASNCADLAFKPTLKVSTAGKTSRPKGASLTVKLTYPKAPLGTQANIRSVKVDLPKQLPSRLTTLQKACTSAQFNANPAGCPAGSRIGYAKATTPLIPVPLEGPAYFVSHGGEAFPNLIMVLQGYGITIDLVGDTFISKAGITSSTFKTVPDQPVESFELTLPQGANSALAANANLCKSSLSMPTAFLAQNGAEIHESIKIGVSGCSKAKKTAKPRKTGKGKGKKK